MELVEDHRADARQGGLGEQPAREEPLGHVADPRARAGDLLEPDLVADRLAGPLAQLLRDPPRRQPRRQAARLEHHHLAVAGEAGREQRRRDARGLPRAGRRLDDQRRRGAERGDDVGQHLVDGERLPHGPAF